MGICKVLFFFLQILFVLKDKKIIPCCDYFGLNNSLFSKCLQTYINNTVEQYGIGQ